MNDAALVEDLNFSDFDDVLSTIETDEIDVINDIVIVDDIEPILDDEIVSLTDEPNTPPSNDPQAGQDQVELIAEPIPKENSLQAQPPTATDNQKDSTLSALDAETLAIFGEEYNDETENIQHQLDQWLHHKEAVSAIESIRRSFHTLKGSGRMVGATALGDYAWEHENLLNHVISGQLLASDELYDFIEESQLQLYENTDALLIQNQLPEALKQQMQAATTWSNTNQAPVRQEETETTTEKPNHASPTISHEIRQSLADELLPLLFLIKEDSQQVGHDPQLLHDHLQILHQTIMPLEKTGLEQIFSRFANVPVEHIQADGFAVQLDQSLSTVEAYLSADPSDIQATEQLIQTHIDQLDQWEAQLNTEHLENITTTAVNDQQAIDATITVDTDEAITEQTLASQRIDQKASENLSHIMAEITELNDTWEAVANEETLPLKTATLITDNSPPTEVATEENEDDKSIDNSPIPQKQDDESGRVFSDETHIAASLFLDDLPELLSDLEHAFESLKQTPDQEQQLKHRHTLEHELHTLKGGARMGGYFELGDMAHQMESSLNREDAFQATHLETIQQALDELQIEADQILQEQIKSQLPNDKLKQEPPSPVTKAEAPPLVKPFQLSQLKIKDQYDSLLEQMISEQADQLYQPVLEPPSEKEDETQNAGKETIRLPSETIDQMIGVATEMNVNQSRLSEHLQHLGADTEELTRTVTRLRQQLRALEMEIEAKIQHGNVIPDEQEKILLPEEDQPAFDPLEMDKYAEIQQLSRQLSEGLNDLINIEQDISSERIRIHQLLEQQIQTGRHMQQDLLATRMTDISHITPRLKRVTRQTAESLNKQVELVIDGEDCELDRLIIQNMIPPLEHMIRNSIYHGIESPDERQQNDKPAMGTIRLSIRRNLAEIIISLSDDGRGLDKDKIERAAIALGLLPEGETLSEAELYRLILRPSFTTNRDVDQISGRGIGMDVVYTVINNMGGSLQIDTANTCQDIEQGTRFMIRLPLTLATNQVLIVESNNQHYALPMSSITGLQRITQSELEHHHTTANAEGKRASLDYQNHTYPLQSLNHLLGLSTAQTRQPDSKIPIVFINSDGHYLALQLDKLIGNREIILKPLPNWKNIPALYSTASIQADGEVILVLNISELVHWRTSSSQTIEQQPQMQQRQQSDGNTVLVVDDSITVRKVTEQILSNHHFNVATAKDGMDALEVLEQTMPDIMLLDIEMPRMDGFELMSVLQERKEYQHLPVIMISSRTGEKHHEKAHALGVKQFLGKPYEESVLLDSIHRLLKKPTNAGDQT